MKNQIYPYPVETLKHWYVTVVGGQSADLKPNQVGVNMEALAENTDIVPNEDTVMISKLEGRGMPLITKKYFTVVPLDENSPDALLKSPIGEVVFPVQVKKEWFLEPVEIGESVVLNNVLSQRYPNRLVNFMDRFIKSRSGMPYIEYDDN
jgi:hypothetical protein